MENIVEKIIDLPLFKGINKNRLIEIAGSTKLSFEKIEEGGIIFSEGEIAECLNFILSGKVELSISAFEKQLTIKQYVEYPDVLAADSIVGKYGRYAYNASAYNNVSLLRIEKYDFLNLLAKDNIFMVNYLNMLASGLQNCQDLISTMKSVTLNEKLKILLITMTRRNNQKVILETTGTAKLNEILEESPLNLHRYLENAKKRELLNYSENRLEIFNRNSFLYYLSKNRFDN